MSLVDESVSTEMQLNVRSTADENSSRSISESTAASVSTTAIIVAMLGSIIPDPFAMPTTRAAPDPMARSAIFGTVSVVMIPRAGPSIESPSGDAGIAAIPRSIRSIG